MQRDIRNLLTRARDSFDTIQLEWSAESNGLVLARAMERSIANFEQRVKEGSIVRLEATKTSASTATREDDGDDDPWSRNVWRAWWRKPSSWRDDYLYENGGGAAIQIARGGSSSVYVPMVYTLYTNQRPDGLFARLKSALGPKNRFELPTVESRLRETVLVDPSFLTSGWELTVLDDRMHAGRNAVRVRATRRATEPRLSYWDYIKDYEILVDAERGILLRYAGIVDGAEAGILSVKTVRFDEPIRDEVFSDQAPEGTRIAWVSGSSSTPN